MENKYLKNIKVGMKVLILTSQKKYSAGIVEEIALGNQFNEGGIMVRLKNGDIGRVKKIILNELEQNAKFVEEIKKMMASGENLHTEFKAEALWSINYNNNQIKESKSFELREYGHRASKIIIAKSIASFLNSDGGNLIIGIRENKEERKFDIFGINEEMKKIRQPGTDGYKRMIIDEILRTFFPAKIYNHIDYYISIDFIKIEEKIVCWIRIKKSESKVFLKINDKDVFMIRTDSENRTLDGERLVDYCIKKW